MKLNYSLIVKSTIANVLKDKGWSVYQDVFCVSNDGSDRFCDMVAINADKSEVAILGPTVRFEDTAEQADAVDREKRNIYEPCIPYLAAKYAIDEDKLRWQVYYLAQKVEMALIFDTFIYDTIALLGLVAGLVYYYLTCNYDYWKKRNIPYIEPEFFYGNFKDILTFKSNQPEVTDRFYQHFKQFGLGYGGIFQLRDPVLLVFSPDIIKDMLVKNFPSFHDRGFAYDENFDPLSAHLILLAGPKWKYLRAKLTPTFTTGKLKLMMPLVRQCAESLEDKLEKICQTGEMAEFREVIAQFTTDVIGSCVFGLQLNALEDPNCDFRRLGRKVMAPTEWEKMMQNIRNIYPWLYKIFKFPNYDKEVTEFFVNTFRRTVEHRKKENIHRNDFISLLMQIRDTKVTTLKSLDGTELSEVENYDTNVDKDAFELTDEILAAQTFGFFIAGFETSSTTVGHLLLELAKWPEIQDKMADEIEEALTRHNGDINYDFLQDLKYMDQVIDESIRLYPPATMLPRECTLRYKMPGSDFYVEPGMKVYVPIWSLHRDPQYWENPEEFNPDRFSSENRQKIPPNVFLPFGLGPRLCIGMRFAYVQMKTGLCKILRNYRVVPCEKTKPFRIDPRTFVLSCQDGAWLRLQKR